MSSVTASTTASLVEVVCSRFAHVVEAGRRGGSGRPLTLAERILFTP
ncbi:MAG: hypothetical protein ACRD0K_04430 [Egibacteraceae bacterium]